MADVVLKSISKHFDQTKVLEDISLSIADREFIVLVGPSGCGKSTVLRLIAGLESLSAGEIQIGDRVVNHVAPKDRDIAMVFQNYALYPHMSVYDNMAFGLKMRKVPKADIDRQVRETAAILGLEQLLNRKPKQLSGGQRQRVALGRAIVRHPQVFLMDEPLSNLDAKMRVQMRLEIARLHKRLNATTLYVTHDQVEAMTMGDRIVVLHQGRIQQVDRPLSVYRYPANLFVAGFIGQMNFLTAIAGDNGDLMLPDQTRLSVPARFHEALKAHGGKGVVLGMRPEHFEIDLPPESDAAEYWRWEVTPEQIELLGTGRMAHFQYAGAPVAALLPADFDVAIGRPVTVWVNLTSACLFDAASEARLV